MGARSQQDRMGRGEDREGEGEVMTTDNRTTGPEEQRRGQRRDDWHEDHGQNHRHDPASPPPLLQATARRVDRGVQEQG
jgi:hypothetical protein